MVLATAHVLLRVCNGVRDDAPPWPTRCTETFALDTRWAGDPRRGGEPIVGGGVELLDGERAIPSRDVESGASGKVSFEKRHAACERQRRMRSMVSERRTSE